MIALLSAALIGEPVTGRQWGGVLLGFIGVIAILRPGTDAFSWFTLLPLLGSCLLCSCDGSTRGKCQEEGPLVLALALHGSFLVTGLIAAVVLALIGLGTDTQGNIPVPAR